MLFLIMLLLCQGTVIYPEDHGLFIPNEIASINKIGENWLICSMFGNKLILFSPDGKQLAVWDRQGEGPGEIVAPYILGVGSNDLLAVSLNGRVLAFDSKLQWMEDVHYPRLQFGRGTVIQSGFLADNKDYYIVSIISMFSPLVKRVSLVDGEWEIIEEFFPQRLDPGTAQRQGKSGAASSNIFYQNGWFFYQDEHFEKPRYEVEAYRFPDIHEGQALIVLRNQVEAYERNYGVYAGIYKGAKLEKGWLLEVLTAKDGQEMYLHDFFDERGKFLKRVEFTSETKIHPVVNAPDVFIWRGDRERPVLELYTESEAL